MPASEFIRGSLIQFEDLDMGGEPQTAMKNAYCIWRTTAGDGEGRRDWPQDIVNRFLGMAA
jgi:hypothetical protein